MDCVGEVTAGGIVGAVAPPVGGSDETDCASAVATTPANNPSPRTVDLSKLGIRILQLTIAFRYAS
jgi:hypothetical protein